MNDDGMGVGGTVSMCADIQGQEGPRLDALPTKPPKRRTDPDVGWLYFIQCNGERGFLSNS